MATHRLSIVKTSISSFPPYFRNLELNVLGNIFYHHSTIKDKRWLNISQKRRWRQSHRCQRRNLRRNDYGGRRQKSGFSKNKKAVKRKTSKKRSEVSMIRYWVLLSEWCNQILWAKYILFIEIKGFWKILSNQKTSSIGEIRKYWFSRLIIDESPKKNVHNCKYLERVKICNCAR